MDCTPSLDELTNVVSAVHWRYKGTTEDGITSEIYGLTPVGQPSPDNFVDYTNLTFEQVSGWLETIYSQEIPVEEGQTEIKETQLSSMKKTIEDRINLILNPPVITLPLPF
jgi:hypothetical protein